MTTIETRAVLAGAYRGAPRRLLTHALLLVDGVPERTLCRRVTVENLADVHATDANAPPTCALCSARRALGRL